MGVTNEQLRDAAERESRCRAAATQIEQAGRGLYKAMNECLTNTATLETISTLAAVQAYIADAQRVLIENFVTEEPDTSPKLLLPR